MDLNSTQVNEFIFSQYNKFTLYEQKITDIRDRVKFRCQNLENTNIMITC